MDVLPARLRARLPRALSWDQASLDDPQGAWFREIEARRPEREARAREDEARLLALGLPLEGAILDLGGGAGELAARLAVRAERLVLLEHMRPALENAREFLSLDARPFDFEGAPLPAVAPGPWDLILCRYALSWCRDLPRLLDGLSAVAAPGAALVLELVLPGRGAMLTSALEDHAPWSLWSPTWLARALGERGWLLTRRFTPYPPQNFWSARGPRFALFSLPWALWPGPLPRDLQQSHAGLVLRYVGAPR